MRATLGRTGLYGPVIRSDERNSVGLLFGFGFKSVVAQNVRSPFYLAF